MGDGHRDRAELIASRARIVAAADEARRHLERELRDGIHGRLIALGFELREVEASVPRELGSLIQQIHQAISALADTGEQLQELCRGIYPAILSSAGLDPALRSLVRRSAVPVDFQLALDRRLPDRVQLAAYYAVAEAIDNTARHGQASQLQISVRANDHTLDVHVADDGIGGADPRKGSGLIGLKDRVEALGGTIRLVSPRGVGTSLYVAIPLDTP